MKKLRIAGLGEVLWDIQKNGNKTFGGAPANFACHCANLGTVSYIISCMGNDELGEQGIDFLKQKNVDVHGLEVSKQYETGVVNVLLDDMGVPEYDIKENVAWDNISYRPEISPLLVNMDAVCYGSLALRSEISKNTILTYLNELPESCLKVFDINIRQEYYIREIIISALEKANVLKLNDEELPLLTDFLKLKGDIGEQLKCIQEKFGLKLIIYTRGSKGAIMLTQNEMNEYAPQSSINVTSTVGAGDSFTAAAIVGFLSGLGLSEINKYANQVAAFVCTQAGAVPNLPNNLTNKLSQAKSQASLDTCY